MRIGPHPDTSEPSPRNPLRLPPDFYSGHTPRTTCWQMPARANPAHAVPSPFRRHHHLEAHVARSYYRPNTAVCLRLPPEHSFQHPITRISISGDRNKKRPLTRPQWFFAVWHRLSIDSLASPFGPFMVELFAFLFFAGYPKAARPSAWWVLPTHDSPRQRS